MSESEDLGEVAEFISKETASLKRLVVLNPNSITLDQLNRKLSEYSVTHIHLLNLKSLMEYEVRKLEDDFEMWKSSKYFYIRTRENRLDLASTKWLGQEEINKMVRVEYKDEYESKNIKLRKEEAQLDHIKSLIKMWETYNYTLGNICKNLQVEASMTIRVQ